jgi:hypothetical protein
MLCTWTLICHTYIRWILPTRSWHFLIMEFRTACMSEHDVVATREAAEGGIRCKCTTHLYCTPPYPSIHYHTPPYTSTTQHTPHTHPPHIFTHLHTPPLTSIPPHTHTTHIMHTTHTMHTHIHAHTHSHPAHSHPCTHPLTPCTLTSMHTTHTHAH